MPKKLSTFEKLRRSFAEIGVTLNEPDDLGFVSFEYDIYPYTIGIDEEYDVFFFTEIVVGPEGNPPKSIFESALEITQNFHDEIRGAWDEKTAYITSNFYSLEGRRSLPKTTLKALLKDFFEAHTFMEANIFLMMDESLWKDL